MESNPKAPTRKFSLRILMTAAFVGFSLLPVGVVTFYSLAQYRRSVETQNKNRMSGLFDDGVQELKQQLQKVEQLSGERAASRNIIYYMFNKQTEELEALLSSVGGLHSSHRVRLYDQAGSLFLEYRYSENSAAVEPEMADFQLAEPIVSRLTNKKLAVDKRLVKDFDLLDDVFRFHLVRPVITTNDRIVGFLEEIVSLSISDIFKYVSKSGVSYFIFSDISKAIGPDTSLAAFPFVTDNRNVKKVLFLRKRDEAVKSTGYFEALVEEEAYGFLIKQQENWDRPLYLGVTSSIESELAIIKKVNRALYFIVLVLIGLLCLAWLLLTKKIMKPLDALIEGINKVKAGQTIQIVEEHPIEELETISKSLNEMAMQINKARVALTEKVHELEGANNTIRLTQSQLVHSAKMVSLGRLVAGVAHELNNPISFISANLSPLKEYIQSLTYIVDEAVRNPDRLKAAVNEMDYEFVKSDLHKIVASFEEGAFRTKDIVDGLKRFSRLEEASLKEVDLHTCIESTLKLMDSELKGRVSIQKDFGELPALRCYPSQLNQVFLNIFTNAAQAIEGEGSIFIQTRFLQNDILKILISDTGKGMSPEVQAHIFEPFYTTKAPGQGTGLGMSISFGIVEKHGGTIQVESKVGKGTTFIICLPLNSV